MDIETNPAVGYVTMGLAVFLAAASLLTIFIFAFKKIYYRGEVYVQTVNSSLRQAIFFTLAGIGMVAFYHYGVLTWLTGSLLFFVTLFIELTVISFSTN
jgi:glucan phosphoethanolaminetransferase (alkaline phosphatase superfamily)